MKLRKLFLLIVLLALVGGFVTLAYSDIPLNQTEVRKPIPNERFFKSD